MIASLELINHIPLPVHTIASRDLTEQYGVPREARRARHVRCPLLHPPDLPPSSRRLAALSISSRLRSPKSSLQQYAQPCLAFTGRVDVSFVIDSGWSTKHILPTLQLTRQHRRQIRPSADSMDRGAHGTIQPCPLAWSCYSCTCHRPDSVRQEPEGKRYGDPEPERHYSRQCDTRAGRRAVYKSLRSVQG